MRLAVLAPARFPLVEPYAGGLEALVATLALALRGRGHHVTLYAPPGTSPRLADRLVPYPGPPRLSELGTLDPNVPSDEAARDHHAYASALVDLTGRVRDGEVDAVLNHTLHQIPLMVGALLGVPLVTTLHTPPVAWMETGGGVVVPRDRFVAVSRAIADQWTTLTPPPEVIHNGIETSDFPSGPGGPDLVWLGRITPEKGTHLAVEAARAAGRSLTVAGPIYDPTYFDEAVQPRLGGDLTYVGHLDHARAATLLGRSSALLVTPRWDEPFGLVAAESALTGTPVVGIRRGGLAEVVSPAMGVLVSDSDASDDEVTRRLVDALPVAEGLDRQAVAAEARAHFGSDRMAREYETLLQSLVRGTVGGAAGVRRAITGGTIHPSPHFDPVRVQHIPAGHPYTRRISPRRRDREVALPDPPVPGAPAGQWWPHPALEPSWVYEHTTGRRDLDVVHLHFGFEHRSAAQLAEWSKTLRRCGVGLVLTVHDLDNPHVPPGPEGDRARRDYAAGLGVLLHAADEITTLTPGAAAEVARRSGRQAIVHAHPHVVSAEWLGRPRAESGEGDPFVVGVHVKSLRPSVDVGLVTGELVAATAELDRAVLRLHVHEDVLSSSHPRYDARLAALVSDPPGHVDLRVHPPLSDEDLWFDVLATDLAVLPYRTGTHSGWLQMCHDLGTAVLAPDVGYLAEQRPVWSWRRSKPGHLPRVLRAAQAAHRAGMRAARPEPEAALAEAEAVRSLHADLHTAVARCYRLRAPVLEEPVATRPPERATSAEAPRTPEVLT